jgi:hypothetical protein
MVKFYIIKEKIRKKRKARGWWLKPLILATQEAERSGGLRLEASQGK